MTEKQALEELVDINTFCRMCCNSCVANDYYCPTECDLLEKARDLDFNRIVKCYAKNDGNLVKIFRYIKRTPNKIKKEILGYMRDTNV